MECCFFFQAEDGIRDLTVTGVQTCALPISVDAPRRPALVDDDLRLPEGKRAETGGATGRARTGARQRRASPRSEERRVGKSGDAGGRQITKTTKCQSKRRSTLQ